LATAQALGGFMINAPCPDTSHLLLEASSHDGHVARHGRLQFLVVLERLTHLVVLDHDFGLGMTMTAP